MLWIVYGLSIMEMEGKKGMLGSITTLGHGLRQVQLFSITGHTLLFRQFQDHPANVDSQAGRLADVE